MDEADFITAQDSEIISREKPAGGRLNHRRGRWTMDEIDRMLRAGFDVPSNMTYDIACCVCDSLDKADGIEKCDVDIHIDTSSQGSICVSDEMGIEAAEEADTVKPKQVEGAKKRVTLINSPKISRRAEKDSNTTSNNMDDVHKIIQVMEPECEKPYRSFFYHLIVLTVLILALTIAVGIYTVYEFRHLYPGLQSHTVPINITVWPLYKQ